MKRKFFRIFKKDKGTAEILTSLLPAFFIVLLMLLMLSFSVALTRKEQMQDELVSSALAAAVIDLEEYGTNGNIIISDTTNSYHLFQECIRNNMKLDSAYQPISKDFLQGQVKITGFTIYNVKGSEVKAHDMITGLTTESTLDNTYAPNGKKVEITSIYAKLEFPYAVVLPDIFTSTGTIDNLVAVVD